MAKAKPLVPIPQVAAAQVAGEQLAGVGQAVVKAATTPIYKRVTKDRYDDKTGEWVPLERERGIEVTPAALAVVGLLGLGAAAVGQRALRTGTVGTEVQTLYIGTLAGARDRKVWASSFEGLPQKREKDGNQEVFTATSQQRRRPVVRTRDSIADYQRIGAL